MLSYTTALIMGLHACAYGANDAPTIQTLCGKVSGEGASIPYSGEGIFRYSSIPYAQAPLGDLRFRPPQTYSCPWRGTLNGSLPLPSCVQPSGSGTEDCLYLSVSFPANHTPLENKLPVLVYFHGGNLISGGAPVTNLDVLAVRTPGQLVTVGVNYRLNMIGFLATSDLAAEDGWVGNQGIADAISALHWVKTNIEAFGGDPTSVTIMGQSSGGTLIFGLFSSPSAAGLFTGAISLSGSPNITQDASSKWAQDEAIVSALGCSTPPTPAGRVACLRSLNASVLASATDHTQPSWGTPGIFGWGLPAGIPSPPTGEAYAGIIHVDGVLLTKPFHAALVSELVPSALIISNMEAEGDGGGGIGVRNASLPVWESTLDASFASWDQAAGKKASETLYNAYLGEASVDPDLAYASINSDFGLSCAAQELGELVKGGVRSAPLYLLFNAWQRATPNSNGNSVWPYHGLDFQAMGWYWGNSYNPLASDFAAAQILQKLVGDFARGKGTMPSEWGWNPVTPGEPLETLVLAQEGGRWPKGNGTQVAKNWKTEQCGALKTIGFDRNWWWCD